MDLNEFLAEMDKIIAESGDEDRKKAYFEQRKKMPDQTGEPWNKEG